MIHITFDIQAPRSYVWHCLLQKTSMWWTKDFFSSQHTKKMVFDSKIGGLLYEDFGHNEGVVWAEIVELKSPEHITLRGNLSAEYGGPNISFDRIEIETTGDETCRFHFKESWIVPRDEKALEDMKGGWTAIFGSLKTFAEKK